MKRSILIVIFISGFLVLFTLGATAASAAKPRLFFSDLDWGPKTGWEGSNTKGAAITIWGTSFGATRGNSYVTVNGAQLTSDADYAEWGVTGPARGLERITFWLNDTCRDGAGSISVTIDGVTSNSLSFTIAAGTIYFISVTDGSDNYNGQFASRTGHTGNDGPFKNIKAFNPGTRGDGQYICYVKTGTYTGRDVDKAFVALRGPYGSPTKRKALVAYPTETPIIDNTGGGRGVVWNAMYDPYGRNDYFTYSKLRVENGDVAIGTWGDHIRIIACEFKDMLDYARSGVVMVDSSRYTKIYGNYWDNCGNDSMKHTIYIKTQKNGNWSGTLYDASYVYVGWNEFYNSYASDTHGGGIFMSTLSSMLPDNWTHDIYVHDNYFHEGNTDFLYTGDNQKVDEVYIYNNIFKNGTGSTAGAVVFWNGTLNTYLYNNTFYRCGGANALFVKSGMTGLISKNNIWYADPGGNFWTVESGAAIESDHDLFYDPDGSTTPPSGGGITRTNSIVDDPLFVAADNNDFHIQIDSPANGLGTSDVSSVVMTDYDGIQRGSDGGYDIGAYEYCEVDCNEQGGLPGGNTGSGSGSQSGSNAGGGSAGPSDSSAGGVLDSPSGVNADGGCFIQSLHYITIQVVQSK